MLEEELRTPATRLAAAPDPKGDAELPKQRARRGAHPPRGAGLRGLPSCSVEPALGDLLLLFIMEMCLEGKV